MSEHLELERQTSRRPSSGPPLVGHRVSFEGTHEVRTSAQDGDIARLRAMSDTQRGAVVEALQRTGGNRHVQRLLAAGADRDLHKDRRQRDEAGTSRLAVSRPGDHAEREATRTADRALGHAAGRSAGPFSMSWHHETEGGSPDMRQAASHEPAPPIVREAAHAGGRPLDAGTRGFMEQRFGCAFGEVRIHTDARATEAAAAVAARAYTLGTHIVFAAGQYAPSTAAGKQLLAHELAHLAQQDAGVSRSPETGQAPSDRVARLSAATGLKPSFVELFLQRYFELTRPRHAGVIDPRQYAGISGPVAQQRMLVAHVVKEFVYPFLLPGMGLYEGITGKDILTGAELAVWERCLLIAADVLPLAVGRTGSSSGGRAGSWQIFADDADKAVAWVRMAVDSNVRPDDTLRAVGALAKLPRAELYDLLVRARTARRTDESLRLTDRDRELLRRVAEAYHHLDD